MALLELHLAILAATVEEAMADDLAARFILFPAPDTALAGLASRVGHDLARFAAIATPDVHSCRPCIIVTLPQRLMKGDDTPFAVVYLMVDEWQLEVAEPELYTDYFAEPDRLPGQDGRAERPFDHCWAPVDPAIDNQPLWAVDMMRVPAAWEWSSAQGRPGKGAGIVIAQPDTGVTAHPELAGVKQLHAIDLIGGGTLALDPLEQIGNPSHGTGTSSVMLSRAAGIITGTAPDATHMPVRAIRSVVRISQLMVARAINHAVDNGAQVISMSLGGLPSLLLWYALRRAIDRGVIVLAAAGNCVQTVVWPARYDDCIAVAGVNITEAPWRGSCRGTAVAVAAPAENVLKALTTSSDRVPVYSVEQGQGTSFAVAMTAGVAALWLAHHGPNVIAAAAIDQKISVQTLFKRLLMATARQPATGWDELSMGAGIVDALALLQADLALAAGQESPRQADGQRQSMLNLLDEAGVGHAGLDDSTLDLFSVELARLALEARLCCAENEEGQQESNDGPVSTRLRAAVPGAVLAQLRRVTP